MKIKVVILTIIIFVSGFLIWYYPYQKKLALKSLDEYMQKQSVSSENIKEMDVLKDYTQNGYIIYITYKDDEDLRYEYKYYSGDEYAETYNILLTIYDSNYVDVDGRISPKYKPL